MGWFGSKTDTSAPTVPLQGSEKLPIPAPPRVATPSPSTPVNPGQWFDLYGFPGPVNDVEYHPSFVSSFERRTRNPGWVVEHITASSLAGAADRKKSFFKEDQVIPATFRAKLADYFRSGYDRGHLAPAGDAKFSQQAMDETFFLTNMSPQVGDGFNRNYWSMFETFCRDLTQQYESVRILTGPLYLPKRDPDGKYRVTYEVIGNPPNVAVPTHFYKVVVAEKPLFKNALPGVAVGAFVLPNAQIPNNAPLRSFQVPIESIERSSGLTILPKIDPKLRRNLCDEVNCIVKEWVKALPSPKN